MKRFMLITFVFLFACCNICNAQNGKEVVQNFAENMQMWIKTDDISYREKIDEICNNGNEVRIKDGLTKLMVQPLVQTPSITLSSYLNKIELLRSNISISYSNFEAVKHSAEQTKSESKEVEFIACDVLIEGTIKLSMKEIFTVRNGKITKIFSINQKDYNKWKKVE